MKKCQRPKNKMAALKLKIYKCFFFKFFEGLQNLKETKNKQQATEDAVEIL
jgi:hypothetical protein